MKERNGGEDQDAAYPASQHFQQHILLVEDDNVSAIAFSQRLRFIGLQPNLS